MGVQDLTRPNTLTLSPGCCSQPHRVPLLSAPVLSWAWGASAAWRSLRPPLTCTLEPPYLAPPSQKPGSRWGAWESHLRMSLEPPVALCPPAPAADSEAVRAPIAQAEHPRPMTQGSGLRGGRTLPSGHTVGRGAAHMGVLDPTSSSGPEFQVPSASGTLHKGT